MAVRKARSDDEAVQTATSSGGKSLVIVESPAKAKTINKYLGGGYVVKASRGHVRDLPQRRYGIDPGRNFEPTYEVLTTHRKIVDELKKLALKAPVVYLATDLDREGEAIAWHLAHALDLPPEKIRRVVFNEITRSAIREAFEHPHDIDMSKVDAQQARRILDRVVGYELSPLLWKKVAKGLSAGRVQSVAVRLIVEREAQIRAFEPQEYWVLDGAFTPDLAAAGRLAGEYEAYAKASQDAELERTQKQRLAWLTERGCVAASMTQLAREPFRPEGRLDRTESADRAFVSAVEQVRPVAESLGFRVAGVRSEAWEDYSHLGLKKVTLSGRTDPAAAPAFTVKSIDTKRVRTKPSAPFTTASLQQAAANQMRFSTSKTMRVAQALYEGVDIQTGEGNVGLITYMRTDSTNLSAESIGAVRKLIGQTYGERYLPERPNRYASAKQAQEAHEAIRPTDVTLTPDALKGHLTADQHKLYALIWNRFVACQMTPADWDSTTILISAETPQGEAVFKAGGRVLVADGFYKVLGVPKNGDSQILPALSVGQRVAVFDLDPMQKFTAPSPRFTEASLVKTLEAEGIGRPSTYASIIKTIQDRDYVEQVDRCFRPTSRGEIVTTKLVDHFPKILDVRFTSLVEEDLDKIADQRLDWREVLHEFYDPFKEALARAHEEMDAVRAEPSEYTCEVCGRPMVYRHGKNGRFLACSGYPECKVAKDVDRDGKVIEPVPIDERCETCGSPMVMRRSRRGSFLGCSRYPDCETTRPCSETGVPLKKVRPEEIQQACPECGSAMAVKFARGKAFLGCTKYPDCKATAPLPDGVYVERPKPEPSGARCDKCGRPMVIRKSRRGPFLSCSGFPRCRNAMPLEKLDHLKELEAQGQIPPPPTDKNGGARGGNGTRSGDGIRSGNGDRNGNGSHGGPGAAGNGRAAASRGKSPGKSRTLTKEEIAALGPPPPGFVWTRTGRPVVETWPDEALRCFECGAEMTLRNGRYGPFFSCTACKTVANLRGPAKKKAEEESPRQERAKPIETDVPCPECGAKMVLRMGPTGRFLGCSNYPRCRKTMEVPPGLLREVAATTA